MPIKPKDLESLLLHKFDFSPAEKHNPDHRWFVLELDDLPVISTCISHSRKEIRDALESRIAKELKVRTPFFKEMISCTKSRDDYYQQVRDDPYPPWNVRL